MLIFCRVIGWFVLLLHKGYSISRLFGMCGNSQHLVCLMEWKHATACSPREKSEGESIIRQFGRKREKYPKKIFHFGWDFSRLLNVLCLHETDSHFRFDMRDLHTNFHNPTYHVWVFLPVWCFILMLLLLCFVSFTFLLFSLPVQSGWVFVLCVSQIVIKLAISKYGLMVQWCKSEREQRGSR